MADRAQSEVLGFVVVFGIIMVAVGLVTATGYAGLTGARDGTRVDNAERAMDVFAENTADLVTGAAPSRATEFGLAGGGLSLGDPVTVTVSGERVGAPADNFSYDVTLRPVVYDAPSSPTRAVYAAGAVFRVDRTGGVTVRDPDLVLSPEGAVVPLVQTRPDGPGSVGGDGTALVRAARAKTVVLVAETAPYDVTVALTTPRARLWARTLGARDGVDCSVSGDTVTCSLTADRVYVTVVRTDITFT